MKKNEHIYYNIYTEFKDKILNKELKLGEKIDSERNLSIKYNVSRNTIRHMFNLLEKEGYIFKIHGKGNFVSTIKMNQNLDTFYSFYENIKASGKIPSSKIIKHSIENATVELSEIFKIPINSKLIYFERLRLMDNIPIIFEKTYLPLNRFQNFNPLDLNFKSMYNIFENEFNVVFSKATETLKPIMISDKQELFNLNLNKKTIGMQIIRTTFEKEKVIEYTISNIKDNVFEYRITLNKGW